MALLGIDLGGTKLAAALFTVQGVASHRSAVPLAGRTGRDVAALLLRQLHRLLPQRDADGTPVTAVGISVPGIYHADTGHVWAPNIPGWEAFPLRRLLQETLPDGVCVRIDSDRACYILGEAWQGAARGCRHAVFLAVGTGIGAGILVDGRLLRGCGDAAGAIGWLALDRPYREDYDACGCFEHHASGPGLVRIAHARLARTPAYDGPLRRPPGERLTAPDLFAACDAGDALAHALLDDAVAYWGMAVANLVSLFNPERIIFGGGLFGPGTRFLARIYAEARRWAQPVSIGQVTLVASALGSDAGLYGAARLGLPPDV